MHLGNFNPTRRLLFLFFFLSGFSGLVYQVVWTRMAFASFGIITPVLSVVISVFMLGLSIGSWLGGRYIALWVAKTGVSAIFFYAGAEAIIGLGAFSVPKLFALGEHWLLTAGQTNSFGYLSLSALVLAISILPWCVFMGMTFPLMMAFVREQEDKSTESFSYLYLANVLGAMSGTFLTAVVLVELLGFRKTLWMAAAGNFTIAFFSAWLGTSQHKAVGRLSSLSTDSAQPAAASVRHDSGNQPVKWILFSTGFCAMAMEVVWTRAFTPVLTTQVYSFALIVFVYLGATFVGSWMYRRDLDNGRSRPVTELISYAVIAALLPVVVNDPRLLKTSWMYPIDFDSVAIILGSICPLCGLLGYLTPGLIDKYSRGNPARAGNAYAINVLGCILGPLFASYGLLPWLSEKYSLLLLSLPFFVFFLLLRDSLSGLKRRATALAIGVVLAAGLFWSRDFETIIGRVEKNTTIHRDYAASVISYGEGWKKRLLVNGMGMTSLTPITKFMVHLPLALRTNQPESALIICFGMGTTYRSTLSWDINTTAVELVPGVVKAFGFYHADAAQVLANPKGQIVVDDGRRFLKRTREKFDVIVIDPPPPLEAAGSSLLYSQEFYELAKQHLKSNGILQAWFPPGEVSIVRAGVRSACNSFPYVRCFGSVEGWGVHVLASMEPIEIPGAERLAARMPETAKRDLMEWNPSPHLPQYLGRVLSNEIPLENAFIADPAIRITDDHPYNEYYLLRRHILR